MIILRKALFPSISWIIEEIILYYFNRILIKLKTNKKIIHSRNNLYDLLFVLKNNVNHENQHLLFFSQRSLLPNYKHILFFTFNIDFMIFIKKKYSPYTISLFSNTHIITYSIDKINYLHTIKSRDRKDEHNRTVKIFRIIAISRNIVQTFTTPRNRSPLRSVELKAGSIKGSRWEDNVLIGAINADLQEPRRMQPLRQWSESRASISVLAQ